MLKRQESSLSSSSRRQACGAAASTTPLQSEPRQATGIGCMSGIFKLFSKYQNSTKRLTFGRKQDNRKPSSPTKGNCSSALEKSRNEKLGATELINYDVKPPKIPSLPPEIRRSHDTERSPEDSRTSSSLLMRLIGLEDFRTATANPPPLEEDSSVTEKRKQLLQALEKCNEDLEALKRIINAVQMTDLRLHPPFTNNNNNNKKLISDDGNAISSEVKPCVETCTNLSVTEESNNPVVTTAPDLTPSPITTFSPVHSTSAVNGMIEQKMQVLNKYSTEVMTSKWEPRQGGKAVSSSSSKAMVENVEEVCREIVWGEEREIGMIGLVVQDHLWRELIQEFVQELNTKKPLNHSLHYSSPLPLEACRRRLCF